MKKHQKRGLQELFFVAVALSVLFTLAFFSPVPHPTGMVVATEGAWVDVENSNYVNGSALISNTNGSYLVYKFNGSKLFIITQQRDDFGIMDIELDKISFHVDLYSPETTYKVIREIPAFGSWEHEATIKVSGEKNNESVGTYILIDELLVDNLSATPAEMPQNITIQFPAEINKPVVWVKKITTDGPLNVELPPSQNVTVKTVVGDIYREIPDSDIAIKQHAQNILLSSYKSLSATTRVTTENITVTTRTSAKEYEVSYETPPPLVTENNLSATQKKITVYSDYHYENITTYTTLPKESPKTSIKLYHLVNGSKELFTGGISYFDENNNLLIDKIEWVVPHLSNETYLIEINILNVFSFPHSGENWTVFFNTTGTANLTVLPVNNTQWDREISFVELKCGVDKLHPTYDNISVSQQDYSCNNTGQFTSHVYIPGTAALEFHFGDAVAYAYDPHSGGLHNLTGEFDFNWTLIRPGTAPRRLRNTLRSNNFVYDIANRVAILFGENEDVAPTGTNNTWLFNSSTNNWTILQINSAPTPRYSPMMTYDSLNNVTVLFGGFRNSSTSDFINETWIYNFTANTWTNVTPAISPAVDTSSTSNGHIFSIAFDRANQSVLIFGRGDSSGVNQLWSYRTDTNLWRQLSPANAPPSARMDPALTYDESVNLTVLFGGILGTNIHNETWVYNATDNRWSRRAVPDTLPANRRYASAYDAVRKIIIIAGGEKGNDNGGVSGATNDTLAYNTSSDTWINLSARTTSGKKAGGSVMAFDRVFNHIILFGGGGGLNGADSSLNETFIFNFTSSSSLDTAPPGGGSAVTNFTTINAGDNALFNVTWTDNVALSSFIFSIDDSGAFVNRSSTSLTGTTNVSSVAITINTTVREEQIIQWRVYANDTSNNWNTTNTFSFRIPRRFGNLSGFDFNWSFINTDNRPISVGNNVFIPNQNFIYDIANNISILFGESDNQLGIGNGAGFTNRTWFFISATRAWGTATVNNAPSHRRAPLMTYDSINNVTILFGGIVNGTSIPLNDTWIYNFTANTWTNVTPLISPPSGNSIPSLGHIWGIAFDVSNRSTLIFGGGGANGDNQLWSYRTDTNTWRQLSPLTSPSARGAPPFVYDESVNLSVLHGGGINPGASATNETWVYNATNNQWSPRIVPDTLPGHNGHAAVYDSNTKLIIVFGAQAGNYGNNTYGYNTSSNTWFNLTTAQISPPRVATHAMAFDRRINQVILFGGRISSRDINETWLFNFTSPAGADISPPGWSNNVTNFTTIRAGENGLFNVTWTDETALSSYIFSINDSGLFVNDTTVRFSGTTNVSSVAKTINSTKRRGEVIGWRVYANDTNNNWNSTSIFTFIVGNTLPNVSLVNITPYSPTTAMDVAGAWNYSDADNDVENGSVWTWFVNGSEVWLTDKTLVGYWRLDGSAVDNSTGNNAGSIAGAGNLSRGGITKGAFAFNGTQNNDAIHFGDVLDNTFTAAGANFTISLWVKPRRSTTAQNQFFISKYADGLVGEDQRQWFLGTRGSSVPGTVTFAWHGDLGAGVAQRWITTTTQIQPDVWTHIIVVYNGTANRENRTSIYLNGIFETNAIDSSQTAGNPDNIVDGTASLTIGAAGNTLTTQSAYNFNGTIDEVRIYNRTLSPFEIANLYNMMDYGALDKAEVGTPAPDKPVSMWHFNENSGSTIKDAFGKNDLTGTLGFTTNGQYGTPAGTFNGVDQNVLTIGARNLNLSGNITVEAWISTNDYGNRRILAVGNGTQRAYELFLSSNGSATFLIHNVTDPNSVFSTIIPNRTLTHIVGTYNGTDLLIYVNGTLTGRQLVRGDIISVIAPTISIGNSTRIANAFLFNGTIDEVAIYDRALTSEEINQSFLRNFPLFGLDNSVYGNGSNLMFRIEPFDGREFGITSNSQARGVSDGTPPQWSNNATNFTTISEGANGLFNVTWTDNVGLSGFIFSINDSGLFVNRSFTSLTGTNNVSSVAYTINNTKRSGEVIGWRIYANDTTNNWNSTNTFSFTITGEAPQWINNATNFTTISEGANGLFNVTWTDNVGLSGFIFSINDSGLFVNRSFTSLTGTNNVSSVAYTINNTKRSGEVIGWRIYANDTTNNWNSTNTFSFTITGEAPQWSNNATNFTTISEGANGLFNVTWTDNVGLSGFIFSINDSGTFVNSTFQRFSGAQNVSTNLTRINAVPGSVVGWRFYANDTTNNWNSSSIFSFTVADNQPPGWSNNITNFTSIKNNDTALFNLTWTDTVGLSGFIFSINNSGQFVNTSFERFSGTTNNSVNVTRINATHGSRVGWRVYANDTSNNWNSSDIFAFIINVPPTGSVPAQFFKAKSSTTVNLLSRFSDEDGDTLSFTASTTGLVTATVSGGIVTLTASAAGSDTVTLRVSDGFETITSQITVEVSTAAEAGGASGGTTGGGAGAGGESKAAGEAGPAAQAPTAGPGEAAAPVAVAAAAAEPVAQAQPIPAIARVSISGTGAKGGYVNISQFARLQQVPVNASNFTKFESIVGIEPIANFTEMTIELGYVCSGPRYKVFKCADWNFTEGRCNNDTAWIVWQHLPKGLIYVNTSIKPHDPGLGIGPSPYAPYCGDNSCDEGEMCSNCEFDCGKCPTTETPTATVTTKKKGWLKTISGGATACTENWVCSEWGQYNETGNRMRICTDDSKCDLSILQRVETETCQWIEKPVLPQLVEVKPVIVKRPIEVAFYNLLVAILILATVLGGYVAYQRIVRKRFIENITKRWPPLFNYWYETIQRVFSIKTYTPIVRIGKKKVTMRVNRLFISEERYRGEIYENVSGLVNRVSALREWYYYRMELIGTVITNVEHALKKKYHHLIHTVISTFLSTWYTFTDTYHSFVQAYHNTIQEIITSIRNRPLTYAITHGKPLWQIKLMLLKSGLQLPYITKKLRKYDTFVTQVDEFVRAAVKGGVDDREICRTLIDVGLSRKMVNKTLEPYKDFCLAVTYRVVDALTNGYKPNQIIHEFVHAGWNKELVMQIVAEEMDKIASIYEQLWKTSINGDKKYIKTKLPEDIVEKIRSQINQRNTECIKQCIIAILRKGNYESVLSRYNIPANVMLDMAKCIKKKLKEVCTKIKEDIEKGASIHELKAKLREEWEDDIVEKLLDHHLEYVKKSM